MYEYLMDNGMTRDEYHFFLGNHLKQHCILGNDYYWTNEHRVHADGRTWASGEVFGYSEITRQYYGRYGLPVMHTETNFPEGPNGDEAVNWLWKEWANVLRLRNVGIQTVGFTYYSLTDQVDWDTARSEEQTSELQSLMRISYAVFCLKKKKQQHNNQTYHDNIQDYICHHIK